MSKIPIVTLPDASLLADISIPSGVEARIWDWETPPASLGDDLNRVQMVIQPMMGWPASVERLAEFPSLRVVQTMSAGVNAIQSLIPAGVLLHRLANVHHVGTSEVAMALLLASLRRIDKAVLDGKQRIWDPYDAEALADQRVLIIGTGNIGEALRQRIAAFDAPVTRLARTGREDEHGRVHGLEELHALLPHHDVVIIIIPLNASTAKLVNDDFFRHMKVGALFMNVARGGIVDTDALVAHLKAGRIRAALDVVDPEPLPADHPIWDCPNLIMTPHVGGMVPTARAGALRVLERQIAAFAAGEPLSYLVS
ncbi:dehydrogenase [Acrocarpospora pleiomorpha]|uniref:Dehydrogenase n=1 Tax=Acrocarpospora pleiomorpha TaxID=90975 RepID=A0A5M3XWF7_9ACTN|nr:NAD(P)-dependent oxidoreductase [Acrocarpospora pleiomorpha]GES23891.1 dehydrogenase [Acrocarpospora pleiomorpha]